MTDTLDHQHVAEVLPAHVAGSGTPGDRQQVDRHVHRCVSCRDELAAWEAIARAVRQADTVPPVTPAELDRLHCLVATVPPTAPAAGRPEGSEVSEVSEPRREPVAPPPPGAVPTILGARLRRRLGHPRRRLVLATAAAGVLTAGTLAGLLPFGVGGPTSAAAETLRTTADAAADRPAVVLGPGRYWYSRTESRSVGPTISSHSATGADGPIFMAAQRGITETWLGSTLPKEGRVRAVADESVVLDAERARWIAAGRPTLFRRPTIDLGPGPLSDWQLLLDNELGGTVVGLDQELGLLRAAPTRPGPLRDWLRERVDGDAPGQGLVQWCPIGDPRRTEYGCPTDVKVFRAAVALLASPVAPPDLRAGLFRVIADLDEIELTGSTVDETGRRGTAVAMTVDGFRHELLFDQESATLLASRIVLTSTESPPGADQQWRRVPAGTTVDLTLYLETGVVDAVGKTR